MFHHAEPDDLEAEFLQEPSRADGDGGLQCPVLDVWVSEIKEAKEAEYVTSFLHFKTWFLSVISFKEIV